MCIRDSLNGVHSTERISEVYHHRVRDAVKNVVFSQGRARHNVYIISWSTTTSEHITMRITLCVTLIIASCIRSCSFHKILLYAMMHSEISSARLRKSPWTCRFYDAGDNYSRRCSGVLCVSHKANRLYQMLVLDTYQFTSTFFFDFDPVICMYE